MKSAGSFRWPCRCAIVEIWRLFPAAFRCALVALKSPFFGARWLLYAGVGYDPLVLDSGAESKSFKNDKGERLTNKQTNKQVTTNKQKTIKKGEFVSGA